MISTLSELLDKLARLEPDVPLTFAGPKGATQGDWHVTRMTLAARRHVDCDGSLSRDDEAVLELLDGRCGAPMPAERFAAIARRSVAALPGLAEAPLRIAHRSARLRPAALDGSMVRMVPEGSACRPAVSCCAA